MKPLLDQLMNGNVRFESYTKFAEDYKSVEQLLENDYISEIKAIKEANGNEAIFAKISKGIICFYLKENTSNYMSTFINMRGNYMDVLLRNGKLEVYVDDNINVWRSVETYNKQFSAPQKYPLPSGKAGTPTSDLGHRIVSNEYMRTVGAHCFVVNTYANGNWAYAYDFHTPSLGSCTGCDNYPVKSIKMAQKAGYSISLTGRREEGVISIMYRKDGVANTVFFQRINVGYTATYPKEESFVLSDRASTPRNISGNSPYHILTYTIDSKTVIAVLNYIDNKWTAETIYQFNDYASVTEARVVPHPQTQRLPDVHLIANIANKGMFHIILKYTGKELYLHNLCPIEASQYTCALLSYSDDLILYYSYRDADKNMVIKRLEYDADIDEWQEYNFLSSNQSVVTVLPAYTTEFVFKDTATSLPVVNQKVRINAPENVLVDTTAGLLEIGANIKKELTTDNTGRVYITQYCNSLEAIPINLEIPGLLPRNQVLTLKQYERNQKTLERTTGASLYEARKKDSDTPDADSYLIPARYRTKDNAENLHKGIQELLKYFPKVNDNPYNYGVYLKDADATDDNTRVHAIDSHWSLTLDGDKLVYNKMTREEAEARITALKSSNDMGFFEFLKSIGDFFMAVGKKIISIVETIVSGVKKVFRFILDGIAYLVEFIVNTLSDVFDVIGIIFAQIAIFFIDIFLWLACKIRWSDILRTQEAISGSLKEVLKLIPGYLSAVENKLVVGIETAKKAIVTELEKGKKSTKFNNKSLRNGTSYTDNPQLNYELSNNILVRNLNYSSYHASNTFAGTLELTSQENAILEDTINTLTEFCHSMEQSDGVKRLLQLLENVGASSQNIMNLTFNLLIEIVQAFVEILLDAAAFVCKKIFQMLITLTESFVKLLTAPIKIPFFSSFYRGLTRKELSILDLSSLLSATVATITYAFINGKPLFKSDAEVNRFITDTKSAFAGRPAIDNKMPDHWGIAIGAIATGCGFISTLTNTASNLISTKESASKEDGENSVLDNLAGNLAIATEIGWCIFSHPLFYKNEEETWEWFAWAQFAVGTLFDSSMAIFESVNKKMPSPLRKVGLVVTSIIGCVHFAFTIVRCIVKKKDGKSIHPASAIAEFICSVQEISTFILFKKHPFPIVVYGVLGGAATVGIPICYIIEATTAETNISPETLSIKR